MSASSKQDFTLLNFGMTQEFYDLKDEKTVELKQPAIIEAVAVKIRDGKISGHFHSFVAIDGYDAFDIELYSDNMSACNLHAESLIGAPSFDEAFRKLKQYVGSDTIIVGSLTESEYNPFFVFKQRAKKCGCPFKNTAYALGDILCASRLQQDIADSNARFEELSTLEIARLLSYPSSTWEDVFRDYNIVFNPTSNDRIDKDRDDTLSWAMAFAKLFVALVDWRFDDDMQEIFDEDMPF